MSSSFDRMSEEKLGMSCTRILDMRRKYSKTFFTNEKYGMEIIFLVLVPEQEVKKKMEEMSRP